MIEKVAEYISGDFGQDVFRIVPENGSREMLKTASYDPAVSLYLDSLKREKGFVYALINALTAGEFYGPNRNGDFFPEEALKKYHSTFVTNGHVYRHHVNKDPKKSMGRVVFSHYNPEMRRVEIVAKLRSNHDGVIKLMEEIEEGRIPKTSMGCKVPYDVCSITGKKAKTRADYSDYLKYKMNKVLDDGRRVYAINTQPRFFDISIVTIPADPVSSFMVPIGFTKEAQLEAKSAQIKKEILAGDLDSLQKDPKRLIERSQEPLSSEEISKLAEYPMDEVLSTFLSLRIMPTRQDFQKLALYRLGEKELADKLDKQGFIFEVTPETPVAAMSKVACENSKKEIAEAIFEKISRLSLTKPLIINRILEKKASLKDVMKPYPNTSSVEPSFIKNIFMDNEPSPASSGVKDPTMAFLTIGTLYAGYAHLFGTAPNMSEFSRFIGNNPWIGPAIGLGAGVAITQAQKSMLDPVNKEIYKTAAVEKVPSSVEKYIKTLMISAPVSYLYSAKQEQKARQGQPLSNSEDFVRRNPLVTSLGGALA